MMIIMMMMMVVVMAMMMIALKSACFLGGIEEVGEAHRDLFNSYHNH